MRDFKFMFLEVKILGHVRINQSLDNKRFVLHVVGIMAQCIKLLPVMLVAHFRMLA